MRSGIYLDWDGNEYAGESIGEYRWIHVPLAHPRPSGEGWKANRPLSVWSKLVPSSQITKISRVITTAMLDDVEVWVEKVDPVAETSIVRARRPPYSSINDQRKPPPHPLLEAVPNPPYSVDWMGIIPWDRLTDVDEAVGRIDPATGGWLDSDAT